MFQHPAVNAAAERLVTLKAAGSVIGAPDPVAALQHMDCNPPAIRASAAGAGTGHGSLENAHGAFREGVERAETGWDGDAADAFCERADTIDRQYAASVDAAARIAEVGERIADHLDALASETASEAITVAREADPAAALVLSGDRSPEAVTAVNNACTAVVRSVMAHVAAIPEAGADLDPLVHPATS